MEPLTEADAKAVQALLKRYREQTISVGGLVAGRRFDEDEGVEQVRTVVRKIRALTRGESKT